MEDFPEVIQKIHLKNPSERTGYWYACARTGYSFACLLQMVNGLEARGLLKRGPDPEDGRVVRIHLTDEGWRVTREAEESMRKDAEGLIDRVHAERCGGID